MKRILLAGMLLPLFAHAQWNVNLLRRVLQLHRRPAIQPIYHQAVAWFLWRRSSIRFEPPFFTAFTNLTYGRISAADGYSNQADLRARNLNFETKDRRMESAPRVQPAGPERTQLHALCICRRGSLHFNPYAYDSTGKKFICGRLARKVRDCRNIPTESRIPHPAIAIPFGGGIKFRISESVVAGL